MSTPQGRQLKQPLPPMAHPKSSRKGTLLARIFECLR